MDVDRTQSLTEAQRACLRLILSGLEAKEIARELAISPHAVVERLRAARRVLGVSTSREAARLLAISEQIPPLPPQAAPPVPAYNPFVAKPFGVAPTPPPIQPQPRQQYQNEEDEILSVADRRVRFEPDYLKRSAIMNALPIPTAERQWNELSAAQRLGWVLVIAVGIALMLGGLTTGSVSVIEAISRLL